MSSTVSPLISPTSYLWVTLTVHVDDASCHETGAFLDCLSACNLTQHVLVSTHRLGHTLDLIISRSNKAGAGDVSLMTSASLIISLSHAISSPRGPCLQEAHSPAAFKLIGTTLISQDLRDAVEAPPPASDAVSTVAYYNDSLTAVLDKHAPVKEQTVITRPNTAWYTDDLRLAKQERKALELRWRKSGLEVDHQMYCAKKLQFSTMLRAVKHDHYSKVEEEQQPQLKRLV